MMGIAMRVKVWDLPLRLFHWALAVAIAAAFLSSEEDSPLNQWHILAGWTAAVLIVFRLVWGFVGGEHSRFTDFIRPSRIAEHLKTIGRKRSAPSLGHNPLGALAVIVMLGLAAATILTGAFGGEASEGLHEFLAWALLAMIGVHIFAVIAMSLLERENLVRAMITGTKPKDRHPGALDARRPGLPALLAAALIVAGSIYGILLYDPRAFALRSTESFEQRGESQPNASPSAEEQDQD